ncbi:MAG: transposase [Propionibacteriaceae bacterium]|nr:transposase [Propionibacteriaceae bacterium]
MSRSKYSDEFKGQIVAEVIEKSRPVSEVAKAYGLVPQTVGNWVNTWRRTHPEDGGEELTAAQLAEFKKVKSQLREAQMEIEFLKKAAAFFARESR